MNLEVKSSAILLLTLALGVVLGMVGQGMLMRERTEAAGALRRPPGFVAHMEGVIEPRPEQREAVRAVLEARARRNQEIIRTAQDALRSVLDSMRVELAPLLDAAQRDRLTRMSRLPDPFRPPPRGDRRDGPPPPLDGPPEGAGGRRPAPPP